LTTATGQALSEEGLVLAREALRENGYADVHSTDRSSYGLLTASKDENRYVIEVRTRHKCTAKGTLKRRCRLDDTERTSDLTRSARRGERRFRAKAAWIVVQIDGDAGEYSVYFGPLEQLFQKKRKSIPMGPSDVKEYDCLVDRRPLSEREPVRVIPPEIHRSLKSFQEDYPDPSKTAFIMMPFGTTTAHMRIAEGIRKVLSEHGITALRADDRAFHADLWQNVMTYIYGCGFGIAVFDRIETEMFNPNVAFEVGYMMALGMDVCLLKDKTLKNLQADLMGKLYVEFDTQNPKKDFNSVLLKWLKGRKLVPADSA
jgi:hypothetical protein